MGTSPQLTSEQLTEIDEDYKIVENGAREVQEQVEDDQENHPDNSSSVLNSVLNISNNKLEWQCLD